MILSFGVTPNSGSAPYTYTATFLNSDLFGSGYSLEFRTVVSFTECRTSFVDGNNNPDAVASILASGLYVRETNVSANTCNTAALRVINDAVSSVVSEMYVSISRLDE